MRIHGNVSQQTAADLSNLKKLLVTWYGEQFNDTGQVLQYCINCTLHKIDEDMTKAANELKDIRKDMEDGTQDPENTVPMEGGSPADLQNEEVSGSRPEGSEVGGDSGSGDGPGSGGGVD
jgi:hypothetical protein